MPRTLCVKRDLKDWGSESPAGERTCWENTTPNCCELVLDKRRGSYLSPAALLTVLGMSAACQGKQAKSRNLAASTQGPIKKEKQTPQ